MIRRSNTTVFINRLLSGLGIYYNITTTGKPYESSFAPACTRRHSDVNMQGGIVYEHTSHPFQRES